MGIASNGRRYNVDNFGLVRVEWTDKRVPFRNQEFLLSLDPDDIEFDVFKWKSKRIRQRVKVKPFPIDFKIRDTYHCWEQIDYVIIGGMVFMNLCMNHLEVDSDDEEAYCPPEQAIPLINYSHNSMHMETAVVCTHIPPQSYISTQCIIKPFDRIIKCNGRSVKDVTHLQKLVKDAVKKYNADSSSNKNNFIVLQTDKSKIYLSLQRLYIRETQDADREHYPKAKCMLLSLKKKTRKRKYSRV